MNAKDFVDSFTIPAILCTYNADFPYIVHQNKEHQKLTGYTLSDVVNKLPSVFKSENIKRETSLNIKQELHRTDVYDGVIVNKTKDGYNYTARLVIIPVLLEGKRYYLGLKFKV